MIFIIILVAAIALISYIMYSDKKSEQNRQETKKMLNEAQRRMCNNDACYVCGQPLHNTYANYVNRKIFYTSDKYRPLCFTTYTRLPVSDVKNEFHSSFNDWKELQLLLGSSGDTIAICDNCYNRS